MKLPIEPSRAERRTERADRHMMLHSNLTNSDRSPSTSSGLRKLTSRVFRKLKIASLPIRSFAWAFILRRCPDGLHLAHPSVPHIAVPADHHTFGSPDRATYLVWKKEICGIAALKMVTDYAGATCDSSLFEMTIQSLSYRVFEVPADLNEPGGIKGAFHDGLLRFAKSFGLKGFRAEFIPFERVLVAVAKGLLPIASVNINVIWGENPIPPRNHLVLVVGFEKIGGRITRVLYKDSATSLKWNRTTDYVPVEHFARSFNGRAVFLQPEPSSGMRG